jgi:hypothetical protein
MGKYSQPACGGAQWPAAVSCAPHNINEQTRSNVERVSQSQVLLGKRQQEQVSFFL